MFKCPAPDQLEYFWRTTTTDAVGQGWVNHLKSCETCRRLTEEHQLLQETFATYREAPFFAELANWQPDLTVLANPNSPVLPATADSFELVPLLPEIADPTPKMPVKFKPLFWGSLAAGLVVGVVGIWLVWLAVGVPGQTIPGTVPTATPAANRSLIFDSVIWSDPAGQDRPAGIGLDKQGKLYFSDAYRHKITSISLTNPKTSEQSWGSYGSQEGQLKTPQALIVTEQGYILVADTVNHRIQKFDSSGQFVLTWGSYGADAGKLNNPQGLAVAADGSLYVADTNNHRIVVYDQTGKYLSSFGTYGKAAGQFDQPKGLVLDKAGKLYVADSNNGRIQKFDSSGRFLSAWGEQRQSAGQFSALAALALDSRGYLYALDGTRVQKFDANGRFIAEVLPITPDLDSPQGIVVDNAGNLYLTDTRHSRVVKYRPA